MRIIKNLAVILTTIFPTVGNAQTENNLPYSFGQSIPEKESPTPDFPLGTSIEEKNTSLFTPFYNHTDPQKLPYDMGDPLQDEQLVALSLREPVYERINPSPKTIWYAFTVCSQDGGKFDFELSIAAEKSVIEYQNRILGADAYNQRVTNLYDSLSEAFKVVAKQTDGRDLHAMFAKRTVSQKEVVAFFQNLTAVQSHLNQNSNTHRFLSLPDFRIRAIESPGNPHCRARRI